MIQKTKPDFSHKLLSYTDRFRQEDEDLYPQEIRNDDAFSWMLREIPLLDCPDPVLEQTYYFRWWTLRKHWKNTPYGHILTEFLPAVSWAGPCNSINCATGHHLREARWMKDENGWIRQYILFWLTGPGNALSYSMWFADSLKEYLSIHPDPYFLEECLQPLDNLYRTRERMSLQPCGLFWSEDDRDGMEYSVSGSGLRPTLNSYMYGDAMAIARLAEFLCHFDLADKYRQRAARLKSAINRLLWDGDFYRTIPCAPGDPIPEDHRPQTDPAHHVRELIGYLPWYFHLADPEKDAAFAQLFDKNGFYAPHGLTTAEQRHPRFLFTHPHECLWNGYVWPYATSQTLTAMAAAIRDRQSSPSAASPFLTADNFYLLLRQYALSHQITETDGRSRLWIDEAMHPCTGRWSTRDILRDDGWKPEKGGKERGKDYNHSTFCDLVLSSLLGISFRPDGSVQVNPLLPSGWDYFMVTNLTRYNIMIYYDRDGSHYGMGPGLHII